MALRTHQRETEEREREEKENNEQISEEQRIRKCIPSGGTLAKNKNSTTAEQECRSAEKWKQENDTLKTCPDEKCQQKSKPSKNAKHTQKIPLPRQKHKQPTKPNNNKKIDRRNNTRKRETKHI